MGWTEVEVRELKTGRYMVIDNEPCKIMSIQTSKPGKHGEAKARIEAIGVFDGAKRSVVHPVKHKVIVPIIDKRSAQVLSINPSTNEVQLMDLKTYEVFSATLDESMRDQVEPGKEIQYVIAMDKRKITRI